MGHFEYIRDRPSKALEAGQSFEVNELIKFETTV